MAGAGAEEASRAARALRVCRLEDEGRGEGGGGGAYGGGGTELELRYEVPGALGLQFSERSRPPLAVARITPGTLTAAQPAARVGMVLTHIDGTELEASANYDGVLGRLREAGRPLNLRFRLPLLAGEGNATLTCVDGGGGEGGDCSGLDGEVEHEGMLYKLERDTLSSAYTPHKRYFVLRADGLEYFRLFLAGVDGGDTVRAVPQPISPLGLAAFRCCRARRMGWAAASPESPLQLPP
jgi:hypothetical protein